MQIKCQVEGKKNLICKLKPMEKFLRQKDPENRMRVEQQAVSLTGTR